MSSDRATAELKRDCGLIRLQWTTTGSIARRCVRWSHSLTTLRLNNNSLTVLPEDVFDGLTSLTTLRLNNNSLASLSSDVFNDLNDLQKLRLNKNSLVSLPGGVFNGLNNLQKLYLQSNPGSLFTFTAELEQTVLNQIKVVVAEAAPFDMMVTLSVQGGTLSTSSVAVPAGSAETPAVTVTPSSDGQVTVSVTAASFPTSNVQTNGVTVEYNGIQTGVAATNQAPTAYAGPDRTMATGTKVTLDASKSNDPNTSDTLRYFWTQTAGSSTVTLSSATSSSPTFKAPSSATTLTFQVVVMDGRGGSDRDTVDVTTGAATNYILWGEAESNTLPYLLGGAPTNRFYYDKELANAVSLNYITTGFPLTMQQSGYRGKCIAMARFDHAPAGNKVWFDKVYWAIGKIRSQDMGVLPKKQTFSAWFYLGYQSTAAEEQRKRAGSSIRLGVQGPSGSPVYSPWLSGVENWQKLEVMVPTTENWSDGWVNYFVEIRHVTDIWWWGASPMIDEVSLVAAQ